MKGSGRFELYIAPEQVDLRNDFIYLIICTGI